jgi:hypothetical protein
MEALVRLQIYVPAAQADKWEPDEGSISFGELQKRLVNIAGSITVLAATGPWGHNYVQRPVFIVEVLTSSFEPHDGLRAQYAALWSLLRTYAAQLLRQGEESVLIVQDNEPTLIT